MLTNDNTLVIMLKTAKEYVAILEAAGLSKPKIAKLVGVTLRTVYRWSDGDEPRVQAVRDSLERAAKAHEPVPIAS